MFAFREKIYIRPRSGYRETREFFSRGFSGRSPLSHYDRLPEMVYEMRDNSYTTPIKRERQRGGKKYREKEKKVRGRWQKNGGIEP